jgi:hypothetical protein
MTVTKATGSRARKARRDWREDFLTALAEQGTVSKACDLVNIARTTAYRERQANEDFALAWADIESSVTEKLESKAVELALNGDTKMLEFLLKARRPETYRESKFQLEHSGKVEHDLTTKSAEELQVLADGLLARRARS